MKPMVYVAGPMTGNILGCVRESLPVFLELREMGAVPFMPQWSILPGMIEDIDYEVWLEHDFDIIRHCSAIVRLSGNSPGADRECKFATELGLRLFWWSDEQDIIQNWIKTVATP
jgi:hypothetical protein